MTDTDSKLQDALKKSKQQVAALTGKIKDAREETRRVEAERDEARVTAARASSELQKASKTRESTTDSTVTEALTRAEEADSQLVSLQEIKEIESAELRAEVKRLQTKLFVYKDAIKELLA